MSNEKKEKIVFIIIIADRKQKDKLLSVLLESKIHFANTMYGKGTAVSGFLQNALGLEREKNRVVIDCVSTYRKAAAVFKILEERFNFNESNTGIAVTIPIDKVSF